MSDTFKLAKNLAKDAIGMSPEIEITKIKLPRRGGGLASLREMPVVYRQSGGPTKLMETDMGLQEMFLGDDGNYYTIEGFDERGLYDPRFDQTTDRIAPDWGRDINTKDIEKALQTNNVPTRGETSAYGIFGRLGRGARPSPLGQTLPGRKPTRESNLIPTGSASLAEQITREQAEKEAEARDAGRYGRGVRPSPAGANMLQSPIGFAYPNRSTEIGTISTVPTSDPAYQVEKSRTEYDPNLLIGGNMLQSPPSRAYTPGMFGKPRTTRTLLESMADFTRQREEREARQAADREAEEAERARDAGRYGRGARPSPNAFQRAITTLMGGFQQPDKPTTQPTTQGMVYGPISPDQMAMSQAAQRASELELEDAEMGEPARTSMGEGMPSKGSGQLWSPAPDLSYMDTPEYQTEETWESYDPYGDYSVDMSGYYALKHGGGLSGIVKKFDGGDFDYDYTASDVGLGDTFTDDFTDDRSAATYDYDAYSYGPSESETVDAPSVSSDLPDAAYMGDFAFAPDPQERVGLMGPSEVAGVDIAQTYLSPDPESSELGQYEDVSGLERFIANLLPDSFSKTLGLSSAAQRFRSDADLARRPGYTKEDVAFEQNLNNLQNKFRNAMVTAKANRVNETSPKKDQEEAEKEATLEAAKDIFGGSFVENKGKGVPGFLATYGLGSLFKGMGLIGTAEINGVPVHVHDDGSITVISPENEPGYDDSLSVGSLAPEVPGVKKFKKELKEVEEETKEAAKESTVSLPSLTEGDKTRIRILMNNQGITEEEAKIRLNLQGRS
tara:strand:- start:219 stop:2576 length:2358 start_codon:yes stop_codon:yes gene_type:complete